MRLLCADRNIDCNSCVTARKNENDVPGRMTASLVSVRFRWAACIARAHAVRRFAVWTCINPTDDCIVLLRKICASAAATASMLARARRRSIRWSISGLAVRWKMPLLRPLRRRGSDRRRRPKLESDPAQPRDRASIGAFDPASLPSIETIAAETDIRAFLDERVPSELTRLALRRAWASDPAIRDFIGIAENQWDFNDPNAIPGFGPLRASDNLLSLLLQQALGNADRLAETMAAFPASRAQAQSSVLDREATNLDRSAGRTLDVASETRPNPGRLAVGSDAKGITAGSDRAADTYGGAPNRRSHGSALPRIKV